MSYLFLILVGYLLGSLPFGLMAGRLVKGVDVRDFGSGSTGSTNVQRTVGTPTAVVVLLLDTAKSVLAVLLARLFSDAPGVEVAAALAAIAGHNWPVFIGFKGGRGIAPGVGGLLILSPVSGLIALAVGLPTIALWRYVSLGSLLGGAAGVITLTFLSLVGAEPTVYIWYGAIGLTMVVARHKDNIERLVRRQEHKLGRPVERVKA